MGCSIKYNLKRHSARESASFEPSSVKIRREVWPVGEFLKDGINKKILLHFTYLRTSPTSVRVEFTDMPNFWAIGQGTSILWGVEHWISLWHSQSPLNTLAAASTVLGRSNRITSNPVAKNTSHLHVTSGSTVDEQGQQSSEEHLQWHQNSRLSKYRVYWQWQFT